MYGRALAQTGGTAMLRAADAELLPFEFKNQSATFGRYVDELKKLALSKREEAVDLNTQIDDGVFAATSDPQEKFVPPSVQDVPPFVNFAPLENALASLVKSAERYQKTMENSSGKNLASLQSVNHMLMQSERILTSPDGLPGRQWFKHQIYAPGLYTGYGVKTIPGVREAIEQGKWKEVDQQIARVGTTLQQMAKHIVEAADELEKR